MQKQPMKANFAVHRKHGPFFTGGKLEISKDGVYAFCQCGTKVHILRIESGKIEITIGKDEDDEVTCFSLSPDNNLLVVASRNLLLKQWNWMENSVTRTWKAIHIGPISCMNFDVTSTLLATGSSDSTIKVWDTIRQYCTHNLRGHHGVVSCVEFHPDSEKLLLFTAAEDYTIRIWSLQTSSQISSLEGHNSVITSLKFGTNNEELYSSGRDNVILVWNLDDYSKSRTIPVYEEVESMFLFPLEKHSTQLNMNDISQHIVTAGSKGILRIWNSLTSSCIYHQTSQLTRKNNSENYQQIIYDIIHVPALEAICIVTSDHLIHFYNIHDLTIQKQFVGYFDDVLDIKYTGENDDFIAVATNSSDLQVFSVDSWDCQILHGHSANIISLDSQPKFGLIATVSKDSTFRIWKTNEKKKFSCVAIGSGHTNVVNCATFSKIDSSFIISGGEDCTLKLWPLPDNYDEDNLSNLQSKFTEVAHEKAINSIAVAPNDRIIASGSQDKTAKLWDSSSLTLLGVLRGHKRGIWCIEFSPIDQCIATSSADGTVKMWAIQDFSCIKTFEGHDSSVLRVCFLSRGMQLMTSGSDGLLKLWNIKSNECIKTFDAHEDKVWALTCSSQEEFIISGAGDATITIWKDVTVEEMEAEVAKQQDFILKDQELSNLLQQKNWKKALGLAITLDQPFRAFKIVKELLNEQDGFEKLENLMKQIREDQLDAVLRYIVEWNTNSKNCHIAQLLLKIVLSYYLPEELYKLPSIKEILEGLIPYTEKHFERLNKLQQKALFIDYTWQCMKLSEESSVDEENLKNRTMEVS